MLINKNERSFRREEPVDEIVVPDPKDANKSYCVALYADNFVELYAVKGNDGNTFYSAGMYFPVGVASALADALKKLGTKETC